MSISDIILEKLKHKEKFNSNELNIENFLLHPILLSLASKEIINFELQYNYIYDLTDEGLSYITHGSEEYIFFMSIPPQGIDLKDTEKFAIGKLHAFKNKWIKKIENKIYKNIENVEDKIIFMLKNVQNGIYEKNEIDILKKRKLIIQIKKTCYDIYKGSMYGIDIEYVTDMTSKMVLSKEYEKLNFKKFNFNTTGNIPNCGAFHPLMKMKEEIRKIFLEMGFAEMSTNQFVESSFWNFDSLFQPQQHPSRDEQDTFFMKNPRTTNKLPEDYVDKVKKIHSLGDFDSKGYACKWDILEAKKNILRSHTTACSAKYLFELAQKKYEPVKLFSIDRVFRNEALDSTHLAEFNQVEGVILGKNLTLGNLMGVIESFFKKLGIKNLRFKPAYNPYTEPSMEVFGFHEGLKQWIEIGNSGMFRPEMLRPMGFDEDVRGIGFGLSLERPTMIKYGILNIRDLVGPKVDLEFIKTSKICFFD